jgi:hypothetical protein
MPSRPMAHGSRILGTVGGARKGVDDLKPRHLFGGKAMVRRRYLRGVIERADPESEFFAVLERDRRTAASAADHRGNPGTCTYGTKHSWLLPANPSYLFQRAAPMTATKPIWAPLGGGERPPLRPAAGGIVDRPCPAAPVHRWNFADCSGTDTVAER